LKFKRLPQFLDVLACWDQVSLDGGLMMKNRLFHVLASTVFGLTIAYAWSCGTSAQTDPLPSWNDTPARQAIVQFVGRVTTAGSADFVAPSDRIATFDNDGTLWIEQPMYVQLAFALDRVKALAPMHPEWKDKQPFKAILEGDMKTLAESGEPGLVELIMVTQAGMTVSEFSSIVTDWLATACGPRLKQSRTELVYQTMLVAAQYRVCVKIRSLIRGNSGARIQLRFRVAAITSYSAFATRN
jgi:hypothetical protein